jgi:hypothetical protein
MRAMPLPVPRLVNTEAFEVVIHFGSPIRQGRKVNLSRTKMDERDYAVCEATSIGKTKSS